MRILPLALIAAGATALSGSSQVKTDREVEIVTQAENREIPTGAVVSGAPPVQEVVDESLEALKNAWSRTIDRLKQANSKLSEYELLNFLVAEERAIRFALTNADPRLADLRADVRLQYNSALNTLVSHPAHKSSFYGKDSDELDKWRRTAKTTIGNWTVDYSHKLGRLKFRDVRRLHQNNVPFVEPYDNVITHFMHAPIGTVAMVIHPIPKDCRVAICLVRPRWWMGGDYTRREERAHNVCYDIQYFRKLADSRPRIRGCPTYGRYHMPAVIDSDHTYPAYWVDTGQEYGGLIIPTYSKRRHITLVVTYSGDPISLPEEKSHARHLIWRTDPYNKTLENQDILAALPKTEIMPGHQIAGGRNYFKYGNESGLIKLGIGYGAPSIVTRPWELKQRGPYGSRLIDEINSIYGLTN